jgi:hypothetical protein
MHKSIAEFGARPDTLCTEAIQRAIEAAARAGGGRVVVPPGRYLTGTVLLRSHVTLDLAPGAVLEGSPRLEDYTALTWGHHGDRTPWHLIAAVDARRVAIVGEGEIAGNGPAFWKPTRPSDWHFWSENDKGRRPSPMVEISRCQDVRIENVTLSNPAGWTLHLHDTERAVIRGVRIAANLFGPNTDGIDLTGVRGVTISDCHIACGDDAVALKTTVDSRTCGDVTVTNCVMETNCCAIRLGHESVQGFRRCVFSNCTITRCSRAIDLLNLSGCTMENVVFSGIVGNTNCGWPLNRPIQIQVTPLPNLYEAKLFPEHARYGQQFVPAHVGTVRDVTFTDIDLVTDGRVMVGGVPGAVLRDLNFRNLRLRYPLVDQPSPLARRAGGHSFYVGESLADFRDAPAAFVAQNVENLTVDDLGVRWPEGPVPDDWMLLRSPMRLINPDWYKGNEHRIRRREMEPRFHAFWGRDLRGGRLTLAPGTGGSAAGMPATHLEASRFAIADALAG